MRHVVLHADLRTLQQRIEGDQVLGPSAFRYARLPVYATAYDAWLRADAEVVDTADRTPSEVAHEIAQIAARL